LTSFLDQTDEIIFVGSLKIDRLVSIVIGTENFVDGPNSPSESIAENFDGAV
jgi:hypothetical protein